MSDQSSFILLDGSMGQELINRGAGDHDLLWAAGALFSAPDVVRDIHTDYIRAGADVITVNSYSTIRHKFEPAGIINRLQEMNRLAGQLACEARTACKADVMIAGALPPQNGTYRPDRVGSFNEIEPLYREQAGFLEPYVDLFICETMSTAQEARAAATAVQQSGKPIWVSWTLAEFPFADGTPRLRSGETIEAAVQALHGLRVDAFLFNCTAPEIISLALPKLRNLVSQPIGAYANAFSPVPDGWDYQGDSTLPPSRHDLGPDRYSRFANDWLQAGAQIIGGCCEVGPEHIARLHRDFRQSMA